MQRKFFPLRQSISRPLELVTDLTNREHSIGFCISCVERMILLMQCCSKSTGDGTSPTFSNNAARKTNLSLPQQQKQVGRELASINGLFLNVLTDTCGSFEMSANPECAISATPQNILMPVEQLGDESSARFSIVGANGKGPLKKKYVIRSAVPLVASNGDGTPGATYLKPTDKSLSIGCTGILNLTPKRCKSPDFKSPYSLK